VPSAFNSQCRCRHVQTYMDDKHRPVVNYAPALKVFLTSDPDQVHCTKTDSMTVYFKSTTDMLEAVNLHQEGLGLSDADKLDKVIVEEVAATTVKEAAESALFNKYGRFTGHRKPNGNFTLEYFQLMVSAYASLLKRWQVGACMVAHCHRFRDCVINISVHTCESVLFSFHLI